MRHSSTNNYKQTLPEHNEKFSKFSCPQTDKSPISSDESMTNYILLNNWLMIDVQIWIFTGPVTTTSLILPERQAGSVMTREAEVTARPGQRCQYIEDEGPEWRSLDYLLEVTGRQSSQPSSARGEQERALTRALFSETKKNDINQTSNIFPLTSLPLQPRSCAAVLFWHLTADLSRRQCSLQYDRDLI